MRFQWLSDRREKLYVAFLEAAPPCMILEKSWSTRTLIQSSSPSLGGKEAAQEFKMGFSSESAPKLSQERHVISHQPKPLLFGTE